MGTLGALSPTPHIPGGPPHWGHHQPPTPLGTRSPQRALLVVGSKGTKSPLGTLGALSPTAHIPGGPPHWGHHQPPPPLGPGHPRGHCQPWGPKGPNHPWGPSGHHHPLPPSLGDPNSGNTISPHHPLDPVTPESPAGCGVLRDQITPGDPWGTITHSPHPWRTPTLDTLPPFVTPRGVEGGGGSHSPLGMMTDSAVADADLVTFPGPRGLRLSAPPSGVTPGCRGLRSPNSVRGGGCTRSPKGKDVEMMGGGDT